MDEVKQICGKSVFSFPLSEAGKRVRPPEMSDLSVIGVSYRDLPRGRQKGPFARYLQSTLHARFFCIFRKRLGTRNTQLSLRVTMSVLSVI